MKVFAVPYGRLKTVGTVPLPNAIEAARTKINELGENSPQAQPYWLSLATAAQSLGSAYLNVQAGVPAKDLERANLWLAEAVRAFRKAGDTQQMVQTLVLRARVLRRIRSVESLQAAIECLDEARRMAPSALDGM